MSLAAIMTDGVVGKAFDTTCVPIEFPLVFKHSVLFGEFFGALDLASCWLCEGLTWTVAH